MFLVRIDVPLQLSSGRNVNRHKKTTISSSGSDVEHIKRTFHENLLIFQEHGSMIIIVVLSRSGRIITKIELFCMLERTFMIEFLKRSTLLESFMIRSLKIKYKSIGYDKALLDKIA